MASGTIIVVADDIVEDSLNRGISSFSIASDNMLIIDSTGKPLSALSASSLNTVNLILDWEKKRGIQPGVLPLTWLDFRAVYKVDHTELRWTTQHE